MRLRRSISISDNSKVNGESALNNTKRFMGIPTRMYNLDSLQRNREKMEDLGININSDEENEGVTYNIGISRFDPCDIVSWYESYNPDRDPDEVTNNGFDSTMVVTKYEVFECEWGIKQFEDELTAFLEKSNISE